MAWLDLPPLDEEASIFVPRVNRALVEKLEAQLRAVASSGHAAAGGSELSLCRREPRPSDDDLAFALMLLQHAAERHERDLRAAREEAEVFRQRSLAAEHKLHALTATVMRILPPACAVKPVDAAF